LFVSKHYAIADQVRNDRLTFEKLRGAGIYENGDAIFDNDKTGFMWGFFIGKMLNINANSYRQDFML